MVKYQDA